MSGNKEIVDLPLISDPANADVYLVKSDTDYRARLGAANGIPYLDGTGKVPSALLPTGSAGEVNTASNVGTGEGLYKAKSGVDLQFKTLLAGSNVTLTPATDTVTITANLPAGTGEANVGANLGTGEGLYYNKSGVTLRFKSLIAGSGITLTPTANDITITASGGGTGTVTSVASGNGMNFSAITGSGSVTLGTPGSTTLASTNAVSTTSHTHAFAPGGTTAQYIRGDGSLATLPTNVSSVAAGNGMSFSTITTTGTVTMGTPSTITSATTNTASAGTHTHALTVTKADVGLSSVENTALSTWTGSTSITTVGAITAGTWSGAAIAVAKGGTGGTTKSTARNGIGIFVQSADPAASAADDDLWIW